MLALSPANGGILLPVLMVLSIAQEAAPFSHIANRQIAWTPLKSLDLHSRRRPALLVSSKQTQQQTIRRATLEQSSIPSMMDEHGDDKEIEEGGTLLGIDNNNHAATNGHAGPYSDHTRHQWNGRRKRSKGNQAMKDPAFLRKRTEKILTEDHIDNASISSRGMKADRKTFHFLIDAWAFSNEEDATDQAIALIHKMEELANADASLVPDVRSYTKVINAIARSNSPSSGEMADEFLDKMNYLWQSGMNPTVKPNTFTYTAVVEAHANSGVLGSAQHAEEICEVMVRKFLDENDPDVRPTARAFNAVINA